MATGSSTPYPRAERVIPQRNQPNTKIVPYLYVTAVSTSRPLSCGHTSATVAALANTQDVTVPPTGVEHRQASHVRYLLLLRGARSAQKSSFSPHCSVTQGAATSGVGVVYDHSGRLDSNQRPPAPKAGALTRLSYAPKDFAFNWLCQVCRRFDDLLDHPPDILDSYRPVTCSPRTRDDNNLPKQFTRDREESKHLCNLIFSVFCALFFLNAETQRTQRRRECTQ